MLTVVWEWFSLVPEPLWVELLVTVTLFETLVLEVVPV
jgi:hypothetical protein